LWGRGSAAAAAVQAIYMGCLSSDSSSSWKKPQVDCGAMKMLSIMKRNPDGTYILP
jgi:hypothetical protein